MKTPSKSSLYIAFVLLLMIIAIIVIIVTPIRKDEEKISQTPSITSQPISPSITSPNR